MNFRFLRGTALAGALALLTLGCGGEITAPSRGPEIAAISISPERAVFRTLGDTTHFSVTVLDSDGELYSRQYPLQWQVSDRSVAVVDGAGVVTARGSGSAYLYARVGELRDSVPILVDQEAYQIVLNGLTTVVKGETLQLSVEVEDAGGSPIVDPAVLWESLDGSVASVDQGGVVTGLQEGVALIVASIGELSDTLEVEVVVPRFAIESISPMVLVPGEEAVLEGWGFLPNLMDYQVQIDGVEATVLSATERRLKVWLPRSDRFRCMARGEVEVVVDLAGERRSITHELASSHHLRLEPGQERFLNNLEMGCVELEEPEGEYLLGVYNINTTPSSSVEYEVGSPAQRSSGTANTPLLSLQLDPLRYLSAEPAPEVGGLREDYALHLAHLERDLRLQEELSRKGGFSRGGSAAQAQANRVPPTVGAVVDFNFPDPRSGALCSNYATIQVRVVYVGPHAIVLEDVEAPLAGTMDSIFTRVGQDFERLQLPVIEEYFGSPFALDDVLGNDGRILMVFSKRVNDSGYSGFVSGGDLSNVASCASSSMAPTFYATVPLVAGTGYSSNTPARWYRRVRTTVIHEVKHIARTAELRSRGGGNSETLWFSESTARIAEELWGRVAYGYRQGDNVSYETAIACEERGDTLAGCGEDTPRVMRGTLAGLRTYYSSMPSLTPLGRARDGDANFYNSAWSLVRWAIDHAPISEQEFLGRMTRETRLTGVPHLEALTGRSRDEILGYWALSHYLDDLPGLAVRPEFTQPSWNMRSVFGGLHNELPGTYQTPYPVEPVRLSLSALERRGNRIHGGSAELLLIEGGDSIQDKVLELTGRGGGTLPPSLRLVVVRLK